MMCRIRGAIIQGPDAWGALYDRNREQCLAIRLFSAVSTAASHLFPQSFDEELQSRWLVQIEIQ